MALYWMPSRFDPPVIPAQLSPITFDFGSAAALIDQFKPDTAYVVVGGNYTDDTNRAPGDLKVSWKWNTSMRFGESEAFRREYNQVLSQVNFYMKQHETRYGYVCSDTEFVKRLDGNGRLAIATPIPWTSGGVGQPSVLLALWYLGVLVAEDNNWALAV